jgi:valyl-tRNA synthetase
MGWPDETEELKYYYPTNTLVTDRGIIYFWVARMVMMGLELRNEVPFSNVYIHGTILDDQGRKMSKSLGNGIDPLLMIDQYGADAVRTSIIMLTVEGQDVKLHENRFEMGRNFINKVWNASRFVMMNLECNGQSQEIVEEVCEVEDEYIRVQLSNVIDNCTNSLTKYKFNEAIKTLYEFIWHDFCDLYLEKIKPRLYGHETEKSKLVAQKTLVYVLDNILHLLHPFAPFMTEEIWQCLKGLVEKNDLISTDSMVNESLMICPWPETRKDVDITPSSLSATAAILPPTTNVIDTMSLLQDIVRAVRNIRRNMDIPNKQKLKAMISANDKEKVDELEEHRKFLTQMANLDDDLKIGINLKKPDSAASEVMEGFHVFVLLEGLIDEEVEKKKQLEHLNKVESHLGVVHKKLHNENFVKNAPENIVNAEREKETELLGQITKIKEALKGFDKNI